MVRPLYRCENLSPPAQEGIRYKMNKWLPKLIMTCAIFSSLLINSAIAQSETSANVFIRLKDVQMNFRNRDNIQDTNTVLGPGSVIQIPSGLAKFNQDGTINLNATMEYWIEYAQYQRQMLGATALEPRTWACPGTDDDIKECNGVTNGELFFPVKVVRASDSKFDTNHRDTYGYLALDYLRTQIDPSRYETVHTTLANAMNVEEILASNQTEVRGGDSAYEGNSEVTRNEPTTAPPTTEAPATTPRSVINCSNTSYTSSNYQNTSCLKNLSLTEKAELVMKDVLEINRLRPSFNLDPRLSACMAYRESRFSPNARGGTPDWGMYQVIDSTGTGALRANNPVTPGFSQYRYNWRSYRDNMIRSTLAQADLHHSVLKQKADASGLITRINAGSTDVSLYKTLATRYNGSGSRAEHYGSRIASCYQAMLSVANRNGKVTGSAQALRKALDRALN